METAPPPGSEPVVPLWIFRLINPWMRPLLKTRLRGPLGRRVLVMTYRGRRTGRPMVHPAAFYRWAEHEVIVFSSSRWWLNMLDAPEVELLIDGRHWRARSHVIRQREAVVETVAEFIQRVGLGPARLYRMGLPWLRRPTDADIAKVGRGFVFVRFELLRPMETPVARGSDA